MLKHRVVMEEQVAFDTDKVWVELIVKNYIEWVVNTRGLVNNPEPVPLASVEPEIVILMLLVVGLLAK